MGNRIDFVYTWNVLLIQFIYYIGIILLMVVYGMLSGSMLQVRPRTTGDIISESLFAFLFILTPIGLISINIMPSKNKAIQQRAKATLLSRGFIL